MRQAAKRPTHILKPHSSPTRTGDAAPAARRQRREPMDTQQITVSLTVLPQPAPGPGAPLPFTGIDVPAALALALLLLILGTLLARYRHDPRRES